MTKANNFKQKLPQKRFQKALKLRIFESDVAKFFRKACHQTPTIIVPLALTKQKCAKGTFSRHTQKVSVHAPAANSSIQSKSRKTFLISFTWNLL